MQYPKYITYGVTHHWNDDGRQIYQAYYAGKVLQTKTFKTWLKALEHARKIAESIRSDYMNRGIRAQVVRVEPEWYIKANG